MRSMWFSIIKKRKKINIFRAACLHAKEQPTAVIAEDSDVLQFLIHHVNIADQNVPMMKSKQTICITTFAKTLDPLLNSSLPFLYALRGFDTTSRPFGFGKVSIIKKYQEIEQ